MLKQYFIENINQFGAARTGLVSKQACVSFETPGSDRKWQLHRAGHHFQQQEAGQEEPGLCEARANFDLYIAS